MKEGTTHGENAEQAEQRKRKLQESKHDASFVGRFIPEHNAGLVLACAQ